ncbi:hypothetical protein [Nocardioides stalactiti]|uniref:hypothetical protein n=1 Tax=Nocardioides stalactiti TaxID=2755356 RepID=UPI001601554C|nr:hypothetical protein [Nocardioides stalactiti]
MKGTGRRAGALAAIGVVLVVLLLSHRFGRAEPTGDYRPDVPQDALASGCYPLPGDVQFDFPHQVRRDGDVEVDGAPRRLLVAQYDEIDEAEALERIVAAFEGAGYVSSRRATPYDAELHEPGAGRDEVVRVMVEQLPGIEEDTIVRGTFELDLPVVALRADAPEVCGDPRVTKRWPEDPAS